jgi:hypothetical protein
LILHIVRSGETIRAIADNYQCEVSDITSNNLHITDFKNLKPGMKLRIPFLSKPIIDTLEETESFISDYYPSIDNKFNKKDVSHEEKNLPKEEIKQEEKIEEVIPVSEPIKEQKEIRNFVNYYNGNVVYSGNVVPQVPERFIKKI